MNSISPNVWWLRNNAGTTFVETRGNEQFKVTVSYMGTTDEDV